MRLSNAIVEKKVTSDDGAAVIQVVESFLVRRAVCGHEPTGLHAVFKRLWSDCDGIPNVLSVGAAIRKHKTVTWPDNADVEKAVLSRPIYGSSVTRHLLIEWNRALGGDQPGIVPWVEHVLPESPDPEWFGVFSEDEHREMKDLLGNLIPLSQEMNQMLGNSPYSVKREKYREDSGFKATRRFANDIVEWTPAAITKRSGELAAWVLERWPY
jgi:hypothetical protein